MVVNLNFEGCALNVHSYYIQKMQKERRLLKEQSYLIFTVYSGLSNPKSGLSVPILRRFMVHGISYKF